MTKLIEISVETFSADAFYNLCSFSMDAINRSLSNFVSLASWENPQFIEDRHITRRGGKDIDIHIITDFYHHEECYPEFTIILTYDIYSSKGYFCFCR